MLLVTTLPPSLCRSKRQTTNNPWLCEYASSSPALNIPSFLAYMLTLDCEAFIDSSLPSAVLTREIASLLPNAVPGSHARIREQRYTSMIYGQRTD